MKSLLLLLIAFSIISYEVSADQKSPTYTWHADGEKRLEVPIQVTQGTTKEPIEAVKITFFSRIECALLEQIDAEFRFKGSSKIEKPKGVTVITDQSGFAKMPCVFDAAFLYTSLNGKKVDVGTDIFPNGRFIFMKDGYLPVTLDASSLYPKSPYTIDQVSKPITVGLSEIRASLH